MSRKLKKERKRSRKAYVKSLEEDINILLLKGNSMEGHAVRMKWLTRAAMERCVWAGNTTLPRPYKNRLAEIVGAIPDFDSVNISNDK